MNDGDMISEDDIESPEGQEMLRMITDRMLKNTNQQSLDELHPEDAQVNLDITREIFRAFVQLSNEMPVEE